MAITMYCGNKNRVKDSYHSNRIVLSTLDLSVRKKYRNNIDCTTQIVKNIPIYYLIVGKTHPEIIKKEGEKYRKKLEKLKTI
jgi:hypothetical protein